MTLSLPGSQRAEVRSGSDAVGDLVVDEAGPPPNTSGRCAVGLCVRTRRASRSALGSDARGPEGLGVAAPPAGQVLLFELQGFGGAREKPGGSGTWAQLRQTLW